MFYQLSLVFLASKAVKAVLLVRIHCIDYKINMLLESNHFALAHIAHICAKQQKCTLIQFSLIQAGLKRFIKLEYVNKSILYLARIMNDNIHVRMRTRHAQLAEISSLKTLMLYKLRFNHE